MPAPHGQRWAGGPALLCVLEVQVFQHWEGLGGAGRGRPAGGRPRLEKRLSTVGRERPDVSGSAHGARHTCTAPAPSQAARPAAHFRCPPPPPTATRTSQSRPGLVLCSLWSLSTSQSLDTCETVLPFSSGSSLLCTVTDKFLSDFV